LALLKKNWALNFFFFFALLKKFFLGLNMPGALGERLARLGVWPGLGVVVKSCAVSVWLPEKKKKKKTKQSKTLMRGKCKPNPTQLSYAMRL
jgi:hypothetical protein